MRILSVTPSQVSFIIYIICSLPSQVPLPHMETPMALCLPTAPSTSRCFQLFMLPITTVRSSACNIFLRVSLCGPAEQFITTNELSNLTWRRPNYHIRWEQCTLRESIPCIQPMRFLSLGLLQARHSSVGRIARQYRVLREEQLAVMELAADSHHPASTHDPICGSQGCGEAIVVIPWHYRGK